MVQLKQTFQAIKYQKKTNITLALPVSPCIDSFMRMEKKNYLQVYLEECKYRMKKVKMTKFIKTELKSVSESGLECDTESELKSDTE